MIFAFKKWMPLKNILKLSGRTTKGNNLLKFTEISSVQERKPSCKDIKYARKLSLSWEKKTFQD